MTIHNREHLSNLSVLNKNPVFKALAVCFPNNKFNQGSKRDVVPCVSGDELFTDAHSKHKSFEAGRQLLIFGGNKQPE